MTNSCGASTFGTVHIPWSNWWWSCDRVGLVMLLSVRQCVSEARLWYLSQLWGGSCVWWPAITRLRWGSVTSVSLPEPRAAAWSSEVLAGGRGGWRLSTVTKEKTQQQQQQKTAFLKLPIYLSVMKELLLCSFLFVGLTNKKMYYVQRKYPRYLCRHLETSHAATSARRELSHNIG